MDQFKRVSLSDRTVLEKMILSLEPCSCEMNFFNIFTWEHAYDTHWGVIDGFPVIWFRNVDIILFPGGKNPEKDPPVTFLKELIGKMHQAGFPVFLNQVPADYLQRHPEYQEYFHARQVADEYGEYIHQVEKLIALKGRKLGKKKNLISQFRRLYPDYEVKPYSADQIPLCRELARKWSSVHERNLSELHEENALSRCFEASDPLGVEGICLYAGGELAAFSLWTRLNSDCCDEHYEKANPEFKGSAQVVNYETMCAMNRNYQYVNREQDLGMEGLRHSKNSYAPDMILRNWDLILKEGTAAR